MSTSRLYQEYIKDLQYFGHIMIHFEGNREYIRYVQYILKLHHGLCGGCSVHREIS